jgi:protein-S-isoprenylcysteine O-methyltransferase Ste14
MVAVAGVGLIVAGAALGVAGVSVFRKAKTTVLPAARPTTSIVAAGPYRFTRNPMYLGMASAFLGITLLLNTMWALLMFPVVVLIVTRYVIQREERYLAAKFGDAYADYRRRVRRWL